MSEAFVAESISNVVVLLRTPIEQHKPCLWTFVRGYHCLRTPAQNRFSADVSVADPPPGERRGPKLSDRFGYLYDQYHMQVVVAGVVVIEPHL